MSKAPKPGDEVKVYDPFDEISRNGTVVDVLSVQFTYLPADGSCLRFCMLSHKWHVTKEAPCEITSEPDGSNSSDDERVLLIESAPPPLSNPGPLEEAIRRSLGVPTVYLPPIDSVKS